MANEEIIRLKTAGFSETEDLSFSPGPARCGNINDGVIFWHGEDGAWTLNFADLEKCYLLARAARTDSKGEAKEGE